MTGQPGLSRAKFCRLLGLQEEQYRRYERGETQPTLETLSRIRELTGISLDYLICDADPGFADPVRLSGECHASFPERVRWIRELFEADDIEVAEAMQISPELYRKWESGREPMPQDKMQDFAGRFSVSMDYLVRGLPNGVAPRVLSALLRAHPTLWQEHCSDTASRGERGTKAPPVRKRAAGRVGRQRFL